MKILVVDDEKNMRVTLADILREEGHQVSTADCGEAAVRLCEERSFDAILMDVRMPGMDGVEAFRRIRRRDSRVRVIMVSAYSVAGLERDALEMGAVAFLKKPLDVEKITRLLG